jgi:anti-sigma B factor antagonist
MQGKDLPEDPLTLHTVDAGDSIVFYLVGECDVATVPMLTEELTKAIHAGKSIILDVHLLTFIDSTGISAIASACRSLGDQGNELRIVGAHGIFAKVMKLTRMDSLVRFFDSVEDATSGAD